MQSRSIICGTLLLVLVSVVNADLKSLVKSPFNHLKHNQVVSSPQMVAIDTAIPDCDGVSSGCFEQWNNMVICSNNPNFNHGTGTFTDQLGAGSVVTGIDVSIIGQSYCNGPGNINLTFALNGLSVGTYTGSFGGANCLCTKDCDSTAPEVSMNFPSPPPYFPGGQNTLSVVVADDPGLYGCYGGYSMTLTYTPGTPVPSPPPVPNPTPFSTPTPPPSPSFTPVPSPSGFGDFFCCLYEDSTDTIYKSFCSPMSSCPVITGFTLINRSVVQDCSQCNSDATCCIYENVANPVNTTTQCIAPLKTCPTLPGYVEEGEAPVSDCSYCVFDRR